MKRYFATLAAISLAACNPVAQMDQSEARIDAFHQQFAAGDGDAIWNGLHEEARASATREQFEELMTMVRGALGELQASERTGFNVNTNNGVTSTTITMASTYEQGEAVETFTFVGQGEDMRLLAWNIDSAALLAPAIETANNPDSTLDAEVDASVEVTEIPAEAN